MEIVRTSDYAPVVRSKWGYKGTAYGCMNCGFGVIVPIYRYCPNCGALMSEDVYPGVAPDLVEVVRCRDCVNRVTGKPDFDCEICAGRMDFYCAAGERRDSDEKGDD